VLAPPSGLDRIALASTLRAQGVQPLIVPDAAALIAGLRDNRFDLGITDKLTADGIAAREHWAVDWVAGLPRMPIAFGLWKGDLTLKRAVAGGLERLEGNGTVATILTRYLGAKS
jgi:ABC-type amino acid transport substrate-binding protein